MEEQETEGRRVCEQQGWPVAALYPEPPGSASRFAKRRRAMWDQLLADLEAGRWDVLVVWEVNRANRELEQWAGFLNLARAKGVLIHVITHRRTYDIRVRRDWKTLVDEGVDSADEPERISENVRRAMRANIEAGRPHGKMPYGYRREYDEKSGKLLRQVVHEPEAEVIRRCAREVLVGVPLLTIVRQLAEEQIPPPGGSRWSRQALRKILRNPLYIAKRRHYGRVVAAGNWPPILAEPTWYAVVAALDERASRQAHDAAAVRWLLSGVALCGPCGTGLRVLRGAYYRCPVCYKVARSARWLDAYVTEVVVTMLESPRLAELLADDGGQQLRAALDELAVLQGRRRDVAAEVVAGRMTAALAGQVEAGLAPAIDAAEARVKAMSSSSPARAVAGPDARRMWEDLVRDPVTGQERPGGLQRQRAIIRALVRIRALPAGKELDPACVEITEAHSLATPSE